MGKTSLARFLATASGRAIGRRARATKGTACPSEGGAHGLDPFRPFGRVVRGIAWTQRRIAFTGRYRPFGLLRSP